MRASSSPANEAFRQYARTPTGRIASKAVWKAVQRVGSRSVRSGGQAARIRSTVAAPAARSAPAQATPRKSSGSSPISQSAGGARKVMSVVSSSGRSGPRRAKLRSAAAQRGRS